MGNRNMYKYFSAAVLSMTALAADSERQRLDIEHRLSLARGRNDLYAMDKSKRSSGSKMRNQKIQGLEMDLFQRQAQGLPVDLGLFD